VESRHQSSCAPLMICSVSAAAFDPGCGRQRLSRASHQPRGQRGMELSARTLQPTHQKAGAGGNQGFHRCKMPAQQNAPRSGATRCPPVTRIGLGNVAGYIAVSAGYTAHNRIGIADQRANVVRRQLYRNWRFRLRAYGGLRGWRPAQLRFRAAIAVASNLSARLHLGQRHTAASWPADRPSGC
jgi:hypothetical protein